MLAARLDDAPTLLVEPVQAWRAWTLAGSRDGREVSLRPIAGDGRPWPARTPASAACTRNRSHRVPELDCTCGLHAMHDPDRLRKTRDPAVIGRVALWGHVVEHAYGIRAAFGYPQRLRLVCYLCFFLWGTRAPSGCAVVVRHRGGRMVPLCEPHLELSWRYGYRTPRLLDARTIEQTLLDTYAVDPLREL